MTSLLTSINGLATSLPLGSLRALTDELATGFGRPGQQPAGCGGRQQLAGQGRRRDASADHHPAQTTAGPCCATQIAESGALGSFGKSALLLARQLDKSNASLRTLIIDAPQAAAQVANLLADSNPSLGVLIANLLTTSEVTLSRGRALDELLSALPADIAIGSTVISSRAPASAWR